MKAPDPASASASRPSCPPPTRSRVPRHVPAGRGLVSQGDSREAPSSRRPRRPRGPRRPRRRRRHRRRLVRAQLVPADDRADQRARPQRQGHRAARRTRCPADLRRHGPRHRARPGLRPGPGPLLRDGPAPAHHLRSTARSSSAPPASRPTRSSAPSAGSRWPRPSCPPSQPADPAVPPGVCRRGQRLPPRPDPLQVSLEYTVLDQLPRLPIEELDAHRLPDLAHRHGLGPQGRLRRRARPGPARRTDVARRRSTRSTRHTPPTSIAPILSRQDCPGDLPATPSAGHDGGSHGYLGDGSVAPVTPVPRCR